MAAHLVFILADDLTGAADCALGAAGMGLTSVVQFDGGLPPKAEVLAIDADTRHCLPAQAQLRQQALWRQHEAPEQLFYKKIDSTLRGNFVGEMAGLTAAGLAVLAPAFPALGRTVQEARTYVEGVPLEDTAVWANEQLQGPANLVAMLQAGGVSAVHMPRGLDSAKLRAQLTDLIAGGVCHAVVCDALCDDDLAVIASASLGLPVYWVGSAGLLPHVLRAAGLMRGQAMPQPSVRGPILTVVGSLSVRSRQQAQAIAGTGLSTVFEVDPDVLRLGRSDAAWDDLQARIGADLCAGHDVLVQVAAQVNADLSTGHVLCAGLAELLQPWVEQVGALIVTGGETGKALLSAWGVTGLQVLQAVEAGVPLSLTVGLPERAIPVVTKAGAFGHAATLLHAYQELAALRQLQVCH